MKKTSRFGSFFLQNLSIFIKCARGLKTNMQFISKDTITIVIPMAKHFFSLKNVIVLQKCSLSKHIKTHYQCYSKVVRKWTISLFSGCLIDCRPTLLQDRKWYSWNWEPNLDRIEIKVWIIDGTMKHIFFL